MVTLSSFVLLRFFWLFFCILSWWGCTTMIMDSIHDYIEHPVEVTTNTLYINWETPFPSIAICIKYSNELKTKYNIKQYAHKKNNFNIIITIYYNNINFLLNIHHAFFS